MMKKENEYARNHTAHLQKEQSAQSTQAWIMVNDVEKYYGVKKNGRQGTLTKAVNRVSFRVKRGEFLGIMGASGSGKSTLLNVMAAIDTVTSGHILYDGQDITHMKEDDLADFRRANLGFVFQDFNLLDTLTVEENIILGMTMVEKSKTKIHTRVREVMKALSIDDIKDKFPYQISGGQKQRCACARAIANHPKLILADEPTGALDSKSARMLLETFLHMNEDMNSTILMVTHDVFSASFCNRILFLKDGEIFHELHKGRKDRRDFLNEIFDVLSVTGGEK
jgi:putative ABC transport system ATP-binding protein